MATTTRARHKFTAKEVALGETLIALELLDGKELPAIRGGTLSFELRIGIGIERAREIAQLLNESVAETALTA
jgi:hypothetical protein